MIRFGRDLATEAGMAGKDISVKKYVVRLSAGEHEHLQALIRKGKSPAKRLLKARILLKADVSEAIKVRLHEISRIVRRLTRDRQFVHTIGIRCPTCFHRPAERVCRWLSRLCVGRSRYTLIGIANDLSEI
jgi:hypothetical protein